MVYSLSIYDYIVFVTAVASYIFIGIFFFCYGNSNKSTSEFIVGDRKQKILPLTISLMVSFQSSIMLLGTPAESYMHGLMYILSPIGLMFSLAIGAYVYAKFFHQLRITSLYEYLQLRFKSSVVRNVNMITAIIRLLWYMGAVLYGTGTGLEAVTGFPFWNTISIVILSSIFYTAIGGIKAVIWTDVLQCIIMYISLFAGFIKGVNDVGSIKEVIDIAKNGGRLNFDTRFNPWVRHTVWSLLFGNIFMGFGSVFSQMSFQRITLTKTPNEASWVMFLTGPLYAVTSCFVAFQGLISYAYFNKKRCDPFASGQVSNPNQIMPLFMMMLFESWPGMAGLFVAGLFSASLSTLSTCLSAVSTITWVDIIKPRLKSNASDFKGVIVCQMAVVFYGVLSIGLALLISSIDVTLTQIADTMHAAISGPAAGIIFFATLCPWADTRGSMIGSMVALIGTAWIGFGSVFSTTRFREPYLPPAPIDNCSNVTMEALSAINYQLTTAANDTSSTEIEGMDWLYSVSYTLISPFGIFLVILIGTAVSLPSYNPYSVDKRYVISLMDKCCCCLPPRVKRFLQRETSSSQKNEMATIQLDVNSN